MYRGNILIVDEFRLVKESTVLSVLRPFLNVARQVPFMSKPEYENYELEENKEIYISSAWYKNNWIWDSFKSFRKSMLEGKSYFVCALPYQLSVKHNLLSKTRVKQLMSEDNFDHINWSMEYEAMFFGESENAFYKLDDIQKCRSLVKPVYPMTDLEYIDSKNKRRKSDLQQGEVRIIAVDIALMGERLAHLVRNY